MWDSVCLYVYNVTVVELVSLVIMCGACGSASCACYSAYMQCAVLSTVQWPMCRLKKIEKKGQHLSVITNHTPQSSRKFRKERGGYLRLLCPHTAATHTFHHCEGSETIAKNMIE